jgi:hypothetical protein
MPYDDAWYAWLGVVTRTTGDDDAVTAVGCVAFSLTNTGLERVIVSI